LRLLKSNPVRQTNNLYPSGHEPLENGDLHCTNKLAEIMKNRLPSDTADVRIGNLHLLKQQGQSSKMYSFMLTYFSEGTKRSKNLILRLFNRGFEERSEIEFLIQKSLNDQGFSVPIVYHFEKNSDAIGYPFIVMELIKGKSIGYYLDSGVNCSEFVNRMAETMVKLHQLNPKSIYNFELLHAQYKIRRQRIWELKFFIDKFGRAPVNYSTSQRLFLKAASRLDDINFNDCPLSLLHLDYEPNHILVSENKLVVIDWGEALVGDSAFDVAWAYHKLKLGRESSRVDFGEYFVKCYEKHMGSLPVNLQVFKNLVALEMCVWTGLSPFGGNRLYNYCRLVDLACGNFLGTYTKGVYRKQLKQRMATHHTPVWSNLDYIQNYAIQYLEKGLT
jgi:aminoglycoside phosphotransferase (APT) family kinase protein